MPVEQVAAVAVLAALAVGLLATGEAGRRGRLTYRFGGTDEGDVTPDSWAAAHRTVGLGLVFAGAVALAGVVAVLVAPAGAAGPIAGAACVALLVPVVGGVVRGAGRLEHRVGSA